jgi:hypothetical protein
MDVVDSIVSNIKTQLSIHTSGDVFLFSRRRQIDETFTTCKESHRTVRKKTNTKVRLMVVLVMHNVLKTKNP